MIPDNIEKEHIEKAIAEIDQNGVQNGEQSTTYDLIYNDKRYPPKLVISLANKYANGLILKRSSFYGGDNTVAFKLLRDQGFHIEEKPLIKDLVKEFLEQSKTNQLATSHYLKSYRGLKVKVSFGAGNVARIPWIGFLKAPNKIKKGIYPSLLLFKEVNCLVVAYGSSETDESSFSWNLDDEEKISDWFQRSFNKKPARYGDSKIKTVFELDEGIDYEVLKKDLDEMIDRYKRVSFDNQVNEADDKYTIKEEDSSEFLKDEIEFKKVLDLYSYNEIYKYFDKPHAVSLDNPIYLIFPILIKPFKFSKTSSVYGCNQT